MAKSSGNLSSRRSSSHSTKPYDTNNSFVKKVATKVTDFIPQPLWISKWFNTSQGNGDISNDTENLEEVEPEEDIEKPPPSKRPRIRTDIIHPPGTFSVRSNVITSNNKTKISRGKYSVQNDTRDDFLKPSMAGPSGIGHLICSTPTTQLDSRPVATQRSDLNLLISTSNNGTANGMDDNSESSESTSGCSSLIPQTSRQEAPSHDVYNSPFVNRKRFIDEKLTFTNQLQSPRTLFVDNNPRDTLSNHRPSFNASVMTNTLDRASRLLSPFYSGNTTFGGANAVELYKRNQAKSLLLNTTDIQLKVPKRPSVQVKPSNTTVDPSGMSQTARKILEALEHFSSPISDAKKIPLKSTNITPSSISKKRQREENESPSARVGLRPPTRELIVPTVPAIIKIRRREKLQDTTVAARKIVSAYSGPPPPIQEYRLGSDENENTKHNGKLKATAKTNLNEEDTIEIVNLPSVPLPISSLPNFNFTLPQAITKNLSRKEDNFKFASPIKVTNPTQNLQSINNFTFSSPINAENHLSNSLVNLSDNNSGSTITSNFIWSGSSTAPRPKDKGKYDNNSKIGVKVASDLKTGSVVDILSNKSLEKASSLHKAKSSLDTSIEEDACENPIVSASEEMNNSTVKKPENLIKDTKQNVLNIWECDECLIRNINSETRCFACKALRPKFNVQTTISPPTSSNIVEAKTTVTDCFGSHFRISNIKWDCISCSTTNKLTDIRCVSCNAPQRRNLNQANTSPAGISQSELMNKGYAEGSWECPGCMLRNDANIITCPCCKASQPNLLKKARQKKNKNTNMQAIVSTQEMNTTSSNISQSFNSEIMEKFKPSKDSWECSSCMVRNTDSVTICPCCNTTKPSANCDQTNEVQKLPASGFGDKFKKPEGSWTCDTCMLQNKAENLECVSCSSVKPGSTKLKESTSTSSNIKFNFGIPAGSNNFKFGIDKADNSNKSGDSSINNFKFGSTQQSDTGKFTFGIPKDDKNDVSKTDINNSTSNASPKTLVCNIGFQFNAKSDKTTISNKSTELDKETNTSFSFNVPKNENSTLLSEKQQLPVTTISTPFTFGTSKTEVNISEKKDQKSVLGNITKETVEPNTSTTESFTSKIYDNTSLIATTTQNNALENPPNSTFSFTASSTIPVSSSVLIPATTCLPTYSQHSFKFTDAKAVTQTTTTPTFGQIATSSSSNVTSTLPTFSFGASESVGTSGPPTTGSTVEATPITPQIFTSVSKTMPLFNNVDVKTTVAFGTGETTTSTFATGENKSPLFGTSETKVPVFGNSENKSIFGTSENKMSVFGNAEKTTPAFSTPAAVATPAFGSQTSNAVLFGSSAPVFGNNNTSNFGGASAPNIFSTTKPNDNNVSNSSLFTFGAASNQTASQPGTGFNFSANNNPTESAPKQLFTFGSSSNTQQTNNLFGGSGFNNAAQTNTGSTFTFNAPKPEAPAFGQSAVATSLFGGLQNNQNQSTSTFSSTSSANAGFNFGNTTPATTSGGFTFGRMEPISTPSGEYNFNPPSSTPAVSFDPNTPPSFNFTGGSAPISFNAPPPVSRKIKKAVRRMRYPANDSQR